MDFSTVLFLFHFVDSRSAGYGVLNPVFDVDVLTESHVSRCRSRRQFVASHDRVALEHEAWESVVIHFVKPLALLQVLEKTEIEMRLVNCILSVAGEFVVTIHKDSIFQLQFAISIFLRYCGTLAATSECSLWWKRPKKL